MVRLTLAITSAESRRAHAIVHIPGRVPTTRAAATTWIGIAGIIYINKNENVPGQKKYKPQNYMVQGRCTASLLSLFFICDIHVVCN